MTNYCVAFKGATQFTKKFGQLVRRVALNTAAQA